MRWVTIRITVIYSNYSTFIITVSNSGSSSTDTEGVASCSANLYADENNSASFEFDAYEGKNFKKMKT